MRKEKKSFRTVYIMYSTEEGEIVCKDKVSKQDNSNSKMTALIGEVNIMKL